jgi:hypothetical protein
MKKVVVTLVTGLIFASLGPATARNASVYYRAEQIAFADWVEMDGRTGTFTAAIGLRVPDEEDGVATLGIVARGTCTKEKGKHFALIACQAVGRARKIPFTGFMMDPLMNGASLSFKSSGHRHRVAWIGRGRIPQAGGDVTGNDRVLFASGEMSRSAKTAGVVFGRKVKSSSWMDIGVMAAGAGAAVFVDTARDAPEISVSGNTFTVRRSFRIPN